MSTVEPPGVQAPNNWARGSLGSWYRKQEVEGKPLEAWALVGEEGKGAQALRPRAADLPRPPPPEVRGCWC